MKKSRLILLILIASISSHGLLAYSSSTKISTANANGQSMSTFSTLDNKIRLKASAEYCVNPGHSSGQYQFQFIVFNSKGQIAYTYTGSKESFPSTGKSLSFSKEIDTSEFSSGLGLYKVKVLYKEFYSSTTTTDAAEKKIFFNTQIGTSQIKRTKLIQPNDEEAIVDKYPFFVWNPPHPTMRLNYTLWVSENQNPLNNHMYVKRGIKEIRTRYPLSAQALKVGKTYFWQVRAFDENNQPIGGTDGYSKVSKFTLSKSLLDEIAVRFPVEEQITQPEVDFAYEADNISKFRVTIAKGDDLKEPIWVGESENQSILVPIESVIGNIPQSKFFWQVDGYDNLGELIASSKVTSFTIGPMNKDNLTESEKKGESGLKGTVRNLFNEKLDKVYIVIAKDLNGLTDKTANKEKTMASVIGDGAKLNGKDHVVTAGAVTLLSDTSGRYSTPVVAGEYQVAIYKDNYMLYTNKVTIKKGQYLRLDAFLIPVFGSVEGKVIDLDDGSPVKGATVGFRAQYNYQETITSETGHYEIPKLINGKYTIEVSKNPHYKEIMQPNFVVKGDRKTENFRLERIKAGKIAGKVFTQENSPIAQAKISILPLNVSGRIKTGRIDGEAFSQNTGKFEIPDLRIGLYKIICQVPEFPEVSRVAKIESGQTTNIDFNLNDIEWKVTGKVVDQNNEPLKYVQISSDSLPGIKPAYTDNGGEFILPLKNGEYDLRFYKASKNIESQKVTVKDGDIRIGETQLFNSYSFVDAKVTANNKLIKNYTIELNPGGYVLKPDSSGLVSNFRVPGDTQYRVQVFLNDDKDLGIETFSYFMNGGENINLDLVARPFTGLGGNVVDSANNPLADITVEDLSSGRTLQTDAQGRFTFNVVTPPQGSAFRLAFRHSSYQPQTLTTLKSSENKIILTSQKEALSEILQKKYEQKITAVEKAQLEKTKALNEGAIKLKSQFEKYKENNKGLATLKDTDADLADSLEDISSLASSVNEENLEKAMKALEEANAHQVAAQAALNAYTREDLANLRKLEANALSVSIEQKTAMTFEVDLKEIQKQYKADPSLVSIHTSALDKVKSATEEKIEKSLNKIKSENDETSEAIANELNEGAVSQNKAQANIDRYFELSSKLLLAMANLDLPESDYRSQLIKLQKEKLEYRQKVSTVIKGLQNLSQNTAEATLLFTELQTRLQGAHSQLVAFEDSANGRLAEANKFADKLATIEDSLKVTKFGGFDAEVRLRRKKGSKRYMNVEGYLKVKNKILDGIEIDLVDSKQKQLELDLKEAVPPQFGVVFDEGFEMRRLLKDGLARLLNEQGWVDVLTYLENKSFYEDSDFLNKKIIDNHAYLKGLQNDIADLEKAQLFTVTLEKISISNITATQKQQLSAMGAKAFMIKHALPVAPMVMKSNPTSLASYHIGSFAEKWASLTFKGQYGSLAKEEPQPLLVKLLGRDNEAYVPASISDASNSELIKAFLPKKLHPYLADSLSVEDYDLSQIDAYANFDLAAFQEGLQLGLAEMLIPEEGLPLHSGFDFAYQELQGELGELSLQYSRGRKQAFLNSEVILDLENISEDIQGIGKVKSEKPLEIFPEFNSKSQVAFIPVADNKSEDETQRRKEEKWGALSLLGYKTYLTTVSIDFRRDYIVTNGRFYFTKINRSLDFERATFDANSGWRATRMSFPMERYMKFELMGVTLALTEATYGREGIELAGSIRLPEPVNKTVKITRVVLDSQGDTIANFIEPFETRYYGGKILHTGGTFEQLHDAALDADAALKDTKVTKIQDRKYRLSLDNCGLHTRIDSNKMNFEVGRCHFTVEKPKDQYATLNFELEDLKTSIAGKEHKFEFARFEFTLRDIVIGQDTRDEIDLSTVGKENEINYMKGAKFIRIEADVNLTVPGAGIQGESFTIYENGTYAIAPMYFNVDQGYMNVNGVVLYENNKFFGAGRLYIDLDGSKAKAEEAIEKSKSDPDSQASMKAKLAKLQAEDAAIKLDLDLEFFNADRWQMRFSSDTILQFGSVSFKDLEGGVVAKNGILEPQIKGEYVVADSVGLTFGLFKGSGSLRLNVVKTEKGFEYDKLYLYGSYQSTPGNAILTSLVNFTMAALTTMDFKKAGLLDKLAWAYYAGTAALEVISAIKPIEMRVEIDLKNSYELVGQADIAHATLVKDALKVGGRFQVYMLPRLEKKKDGAGFKIVGLDGWGIGAMRGLNLSLGLPLSESSERYTWSGVGMAFGYNMPMNFPMHEGVQGMPEKIYGLMMFNHTGLTASLGGVATVRFSSGSWTYYHMPAVTDATIQAGGSLITLMLWSGMASSVKRLTKFGPGKKIADAVGSGIKKGAGKIGSKAASAVGQGATAAGKAATQAAKEASKKAAQAAKAATKASKAAATASSKAAKAAKALKNTKYKPGTPQYKALAEASKQADDAALAAKQAADKTLRNRVAAEAAEQGALKEAARLNPPGMFSKGLGKLEDAYTAVTTNKAYTRLMGEAVDGAKMSYQQMGRAYLNVGRAGSMLTMRDHVNCYAKMTQTCDSEDVALGVHDNMVKTLGEDVENLKKAFTQGVNDSFDPNKPGGVKDFGYAAGMYTDIQGSIDAGIFYISIHGGYELTGSVTFENLFFWGRGEYGGCLGAICVDVSLPIEIGERPATIYKPVNFTMTAHSSKDERTNDPLRISGSVRDQNQGIAQGVDVKVYKRLSNGSLNQLDYEKRGTLVGETTTYGGMYMIDSDKLRRRETYVIFATKNTPEYAYMGIPEEIYVDGLVEKNLYTQLLDKRPKELRINVRTKSNKPLINATVTVKPLNAPSFDGFDQSLVAIRSLFSDKGGLATAKLLPKVKYVVTITAPGAEPIERVINPGDRDFENSMTVQIEQSQVPITIPVHVAGNITKEQQPLASKRLDALCKSMKANLINGSKSFNGKVVCNVNGWNFNSDNAPISVVFNAFTTDERKKIDYDVVLKGHELTDDIKSLPLTVQGSNISYRGNRQAEVKGTQNVYFLIPGVTDE